MKRLRESTSERKFFTDSVLPIPSQYQQVPIDKTHTITLNFDLTSNNEHELETLLERGEQLTAEELRRYDLPEREVNRVKTWLLNQGFKIIRVASDGTIITASSTIEQIEHSLAITINGYQKSDEDTVYYATEDVPSISMTVSSYLHHIGGLQPFRKARKHSR